MNLNRKKNRAFTLVELLAVIVIIAALVAITVALFSRVSGKTNESAIRAELEQIKLALQVYKEKNGYYPPSDEDDVSNNQLYKHLSGQGVEKGKNLLPDLKPPFCAFGKAPHFCVRHQGQCFDSEKHRTAGHHSDGQYDFFGNLVSPALGRGNSKLNERWKYNSRNPEHNRESFDLWVEVGETNKVRIIGNWESN